MSGTRTLILLKSVHHRNTQKIAESIATVLQADVMEPEDATHEMLSRYQLVGFGSGIYFCRFHSSLRRWIRQAKPGKEFQAAFVFSTAGLPFLRPLCHWSVKKRLSHNGFKVIGEFSCRGHDTVGPLRLVGGLNRGHPDAADLARAAKFAQKLLLRMNQER